MKPILDHIQITVKSMTIAEPFYDKFLPLLGFDIKKKVSAVVEGHLHVATYPHPLLELCISSPRKAFEEDTIHRRRPGALHHLAFQAETRSEVDKLHLAIKEIGAQIVTKPKLYPEYDADYYALFFKDLEGIKYEIVCNEPLG